jgi:hypothetical protein
MKKTKRHELTRKEIERVLNPQKEIVKPTNNIDINEQQLSRLKAKKIKMLKDWIIEIESSKSSKTESESEFNKKLDDIKNLKLDDLSDCELRGCDNNGTGLCSYDGCCRIIDNKK